MVGAIAPRVVVKETCGVEKSENDLIDRHSGKWVRDLRLRGSGLNLKKNRCIRAELGIKTSGSQSLSSGAK